MGYINKNKSMDFCNLLINSIPGLIISCTDLSSKISDIKGSFKDKLINNRYPLYKLGKNGIFKDCHYISVELTYNKKSTLLHYHKYRRKQ